MNALFMQCTSVFRLNLHTEPDLKKLRPGTNILKGAFFKQIPVFLDGSIKNCLYTTMNSI